MVKRRFKRKFKRTAGRYKKKRNGLVRATKTIHYLPTRTLPMPLPPRYRTHFKQNIFIAFLATSTWGKFTPTADFASVLIPLNRVYRPYDGALNVTTAGTALISKVNDSAQGFETLCQTNLYSLYRVHSAGIKVVCDVGNVNDEGIMMITPLSANLPHLTGNEQFDGMRTKKKDMFYYASKSSDASISCYTTIARLYGVNKAAVADDDAFGSVFAGAPANIGYWQLGYVVNSAVAGGSDMTGNLGMRVQLSWDVELYNPDIAGIL